MRCLFWLISIIGTIVGGLGIIIIFCKLIGVDLNFISWGAAIGILVGGVALTCIGGYVAHR